MYFHPSTLCLRASPLLAVRIRVVCSGDFTSMHRQLSCIVQSKYGATRSPIEDLKERYAMEEAERLRQEKLALDLVTIKQLQRRQRKGLMGTALDPLQGPQTEKITNDNRFRYSSLCDRAPSADNLHLQFMSTNEPSLFQESSLSSVACAAFTEPTTIDATTTLARAPATAPEVAPEHEATVRVLSVRSTRRQRPLSLSMEHHLFACDSEQASPASTPDHHDRDIHSSPLAVCGYADSPPLAGPGLGPRGNASESDSRRSGSAGISVGRGSAGPSTGLTASCDSDRLAGNDARGEKCAALHEASESGPPGITTVVCATPVQQKSHDLTRDLTRSYILHVWTLAHVLRNQSWIFSSHFLVIIHSVSFAHYYR